MDDTVQTQIAALWRMQTAELRARYREVFGDESTTAHKQHLVRRIAWRLQAQAHGDLSERARRRALEVADDADLRSTVPASFLEKPPRRSLMDRRLPAPGTLLTRFYQGRTIEVKVLADGFECDGVRYKSLSAVARAATGTRWNGLVFFGLVKRSERRGKVKRRGR
jgi:DUF2924 family protein